MAELNSFMSGNECDHNSILPTREEVGRIYKKICDEDILPDRVKYIFMKDIGYAKTCISIKVLEELELIKLNPNGKYVAIKGKKTNLLNSCTYKTLCERSGVNDC